MLGCFAYSFEVSTYSRCVSISTIHPSHFHFSNKAVEYFNSSDKSWQAATVTQVDFDDELIPFYSVNLPPNDGTAGPGREKSTVTLSQLALCISFQTFCFCFLFELLPCLESFSESFFEPFSVFSLMFFLDPHACVRVQPYTLKVSERLRPFKPRKPCREERLAEQRRIQDEAAIATGEYVRVQNM